MCMPCCFKKLIDTTKTSENCYTTLLKREGLGVVKTDYSNIQRITEFSKKSNLKKEFKYIKG